MANSKSFGAAARTEDISPLLGYLQIKIDGNEEKIEALKPFKEEKKELPTIHRVPDVFHKMNESAYTPSLLAIGPLHRGKKHLQAMEVEKLSYMLHLFERTGKFKQTQEDCVAAMLQLESDARRCYAENVRLDEDGKPFKLETDSDTWRCNVNAADATLKDDNHADQVKSKNSKTQDANCINPEKARFRFAEMILIDGCFMIELFYRSHQNQLDPIVTNSFKIAAVKQDLLLLENQIPFFVLDELFNLTVKEIPENYDCRPPLLTEYVLEFFGDVLGLEGGELKKKDCHLPAHIPHLLHSCYLPTGEEPAGSPQEEMKLVLKNFKHSAAELDLGGTKFVQRNNKNIFDVKFTTHDSYFPFLRRGEFEIPPFIVNDGTELILRNLIALEQSCPYMVKRYFTSQAFLMDKLINTAEDVKLLEKEEIICNKMGSRQEVASLFNKLCRNIDIDSLYSTKDCLEVINFHRHHWPKFQVKLQRDYFSNPWTIISVLAAFVLFGLTLTQTIFAVI